jgi:hypothetical protein
VLAIKSWGIGGLGTAVTDGEGLIEAAGVVEDGGRDVEAGGCVVVGVVTVGEVAAGVEATGVEAGGVVVVELEQPAIEKTRASSKTSENTTGRHCGNLFLTEKSIILPPTILFYLTSLAI